MKRCLFLPLIVALFIAACSGGNDSDDALAKEYLETGIRQYADGETDSALWNFKQAEQLAQESGCDSLLMESCMELSKVNARSANFRLAHHYANRVYETAQRLGDNEHLALGCNMLACIYDMQDSTEKAFRCIDELKKYANYGTPKQRAYYLANIGIFYMRKRENELAKEYLNRSIAVTPIADAFCSLAVICGREGDMQEADRLWKIALQTPDLYYKITFLKAIATQYYQMGQYREACEISDQVVSLTDTLTRRQQTAKIQELQLRYDQQSVKRQMEHRMFLAILIILTLVIIGAGFVLYARFKQQRMSRLISNSQSLVDIYTRQIGVLEQTGKEAEQRIKELRKRISALQKKQSVILTQGRLRFQELKDGGKTVKWSKEDFENFVEYYKVVDLPFVQHLETEYGNLSSTHKVFMILLHEGKSDDDVQEIMGLSNGAFRTAKYRIKKKILVP